MDRLATGGRWFDRTGPKSVRLLVERVVRVSQANLVGPNRRDGFLSLLIVSAALTLSGCASAPPGQQSTAAASDDINDDPYESANRAVWAFDITLDKYLLKPIAVGYRTVTPQFAQTGIANALNNLKSPTIFVNDLLQGNTDRAGDTFARIAINTTIGLGGFIDVAAKNKIPFHESDFGQTLGSWGVPTGPYLVLPLLGPSDPRDGIGYGVDSFADPYSIETRAHGLTTAEYSRAGIGLVSDRAQTIDELDELQKSSLDFYAAVRSLYQQQRAAAVSTAINDGATINPTVPADSVQPSTGPVPSKPPAVTKKPSAPLP